MWYKIVEKHPDKLKTLFHGTNGSRTLELGVWLEAKIKMVRDGSGGKKYKSGWHIFKNYGDAVGFLEKFKKRRELLCIVPCLASGNVRVKPSNSIVYLAERIKIYDTFSYRNVDMDGRLDRNSKAYPTYS